MKTEQLKNVHKCLHICNYTHTYIYRHIKLEKSGTMEMILTAVLFLESHYSYNIYFSNIELASWINFSPLVSEWSVSVMNYNL